MTGCAIVTYRCNAQCQMCKIWEHPTRKSEEITPDILDKIPDNFMDRINLTGGEPTIRDDIEELVRVLRKKAKLVELSTNGYYTERVVRVADKYPDIMVRVSVEGLPALNDKWRGTKDGFDHALRTMLELKKTKAKNIGFSIVIHDGNAPDLLSLYELCAHLGVELGNSTMHNSWFFHTTENKINNLPLAVETEKEFIRALLRSRRSGVKMRVKDWLRAYFNLNILQHLQGKKNLLCECPAGRDLFFVDPYGNVLPCNGTVEPWVMGNLKTQSFDEIWNGPQAVEVRHRVAQCRLECAFIGTSRIDMRRRPWKVVSWIAKSKLKLAAGGDALWPD